VYEDRIDTRGMFARGVVCTGQAMVRRNAAATLAVRASCGRPRTAATAAWVPLSFRSPWLAAASWSAVTSSPSVHCPSRLAIAQSSPRRTAQSQRSNHLACSINGGASSRAEAFTSAAETAPSKTHTERSDVRVVAGDTIFALSSGGGSAAGVSVIRISGCDAQTALRNMLSEPSNMFPAPRNAALRRLHHPVTRELLDHAIVLFFPGPRSFTGEDVVELHVHGSRAVVAGVTDALASTSARPAERGEFTRRAFENGRMDLTEVEGLADLIAADTAEQRRQALRQLGGDFKVVFEGWREEIKGCLAHAEAVIDFGEDVDDGAFEAIVPRVIALREVMKRRMNDDRRGEIVRCGVRVTIVGPPNAGKSTLLNILARRPAAIVSPQAGTTRDIVEVSLDMNGVPVVLCDTAGLRTKTDDLVEIEGMRRARKAAAESDITLFVQDASESSFSLENISASLSSLILVDNVANRVDSKSKAAMTPTHTSSSSIIIVANKVDLVRASECIRTDLQENTFFTSLKDGVGVEALVDGLERAVRRRLEGSDNGDENGQQRPQEDAPVITRARHRYHVERAVEALEVFVAGRTGEIREHYLPMDLATEELRIASYELGAVTGVIHVEEVLDVIFSDFCIGK
jgi:tRNA modification GTPase